jgi:RNA polymerase sigma-70 factor (ECF subfamily)
MNTKTNSIMKHTKYSEAEINRMEGFNEIIENLYNEHYNSTYYYVLRTVKNQADAEEVTSDVFDKARRFYHTFDENKSAIETWLRNVTNSVVLDFFKTNHQDRYTAVSDFADSNDENKSYFDFVAPQNDNADQMILDDELNARIAEAFDSLKPKYKRVATLFFLKEQTYEEIAETVNIPMGSVKGMLSRARVKLQEALDGVYGLKAVNVQKAEV